MITLAQVGAGGLLISITTVDTYAQSLAMRRDHRDITDVLPAPQVGWFWNGQTFTATPPTINLSKVAARHEATLKAACAAAIVAGFTSSALGNPHTYPSTETDQRNLSDAATAAGSAAAGWAALLWCEAGSAWAFTSHTAAQVQQVMADWIIYRTTQQQTLVTLQAAVAAATTLAAIDAVVWP